MLRSFDLVVIAASITAALGASTAQADDRYAPELLKPYVPAVSMDARPPTARGRKSDARFGATASSAAAMRSHRATDLETNVITRRRTCIIGNDGLPRTAAAVRADDGPNPRPVAIDMASIRAGSRTPLSEPPCATGRWPGSRRRFMPAPYGLAAAGTTAVRHVMLRGGNGNPDRHGDEHCVGAARGSRRARRHPRVRHRLQCTRRELRWRADRRPRCGRHLCRFRSASPHRHRRSPTRTTFRHHGRRPVPPRRNAVAAGR